VKARWIKKRIAEFYAGIINEGVLLLLPQDPVPSLSLMMG
jgi:hypothetical protein